jgi:hypothetical protein
MVAGTDNDHFVEAVSAFLARLPQGAIPHTRPLRHSHRIQNGTGLNADADAG